MPSLAQRRRRQRALSLSFFIGFFGDLELFAGAQFLCVHAVGAHEIFDADLVFAGDFPEVVAGLNGVDLFLGFWRGWGGCLDGGLG